MGAQNKKYKNAVLYFINHCNNKYLGDTKLYKLLYYLDFAHYRDNKKSVTGDSYLHLDFGPVPQKAREIVADLVREKDIEKEEVLLEGGGHKVKYQARTTPAMSVFTKKEKDLLEQICEEFKNWSTSKIVTQTHLEAPWFYSLPGEKIKYKYAQDIDLV